MGLNLIKVDDVRTTGDARRLILEVIVGLRDGRIDPTVGMAIAANMKVVNENIQTEINLVKATLLAKEHGHDFGRIVHMGTKLIGSVEDSPRSCLEEDDEAAR